MGLIIEELRKEVGFDSHEYNEIIGDYLIDYSDDASHTVEVVDSKYENGGRWHNYEITVYKVTEDGEVAYFEIVEEVPATEMQELGDFSLSFNEVVPKAKITIVYESE